MRPPMRPPAPTARHSSIWRPQYALLAILALVIFGKAVVWTLVVKLFRYPWRTAVLTGTGLTQIGEFSFILVQVAHASGLLGDQFYYATLAASLLSILVNAALVRAAPRWLGSARVTAKVPA